MTSSCSCTAAAAEHLSLMIDFLVSVAIELNPEYVRALLRRAELYEQTEKLDEALEDYQKVLERDPSQTSARQACMVSSLTARLKWLMLCPVGADRINCRQSLTSDLYFSQRLPQQINERNEKLKEEMLGKCCKSLIFYENFMNCYI